MLVYIYNLFILTDSEVEYHIQIYSLDDIQPCSMQCLNCSLQLANSLYYSITVELANTLNDPEGFLIQARSGTNVSSEIIGTFFDPAVVRIRDPTIPINYKILNCN